MIASPHLEASQEFRSILERNAGSSVQTTRALASDVSEESVASIFNGKRRFDPARLGAMIAYFVEHGRDIYKTNLNKLLFYADLTAYQLNSRGISGATYINMPFGPVPENVESVLAQLVESGDIIRREVPEVGRNAVRFEPGVHAREGLDDAERRVLDWVLETYGDLGAGELSELSHRERAYRDTRPLEPIAYEYSKFFNKLPPAA